MQKLHRWWSRDFDSAEEQQVWDWIARRIRRSSVPWQDQPDVAQAAAVLHLQFLRAKAGRLPLIDDANYRFIRNLLRHHKNDLRSYILAACVGRAIRVQRKWVARHETDDLTLTETAERRAGSPVEETASREESRRVKDAMKTLSKAQKLVVGRHYWGRQRSLEEIGDVLGIDRKRTSEVHIGALQRLKRQLIA